MASRHVLNSLIVLLFLVSTCFGQDIFAARPPATGITFDAEGSANSGTSNVTNLSYNHTVAADADFIICGVVADATADNSAMTLNTSTSMTAVGAAKIHASTGQLCKLYYKTSPPTGTVDVDLNWTTGSEQLGVFCASFKGVHQSTPLGTLATAEGTSAAPSVDATSASGDVVFDVSDANGTPGTWTAGTGQTVCGGDECGTSFSNSAHGGASSAESATGGTTTMSWSYTGGSHEWVSCAVAIKPAS